MADIRKVGILTLQFSNNYGAMYQAYALSHFLEENGFEVSIINYNMDRPSIWTYIKHPVALFRKLLARNAFSLSFLRNRRQIVNSYAAEENAQAIFDEFRTESLNISEKAYTFRKLVDEDFGFDAVIVGSDQVWAADFVFSSPAYLLAFVKEEVRKIAYAPSFGKKDLEGYLTAPFKLYSKNIDYLSVRESSGVDLVKRIAGRDVPKVVDPTLLLDSYDEIISYSLVPVEKYIVCYHLDQEVKLTNWFIESIQGLSKSLGFKVIYVSPNTDSSSSPWSPQMPTPGELLGLIKNASLVFTNSFHGTVFSLLLKAEFLVFARDSFSDKQNLRMLELLNDVGLSNRYVKPFESSDAINTSLDVDIDWSVVDGLLELGRKKSIDFLMQALDRK